MHPIGIDYLTLGGLAPLDFVRVAAGAGADTVALHLQSIDPPSEGWHAYSLLEDASLRRDLRTALDDHGIRVGMLDGLLVAPERSVAEYERHLADLAELDVGIANSVSFDEMERSIDEFGRLAEPLPTLRHHRRPRVVSDADGAYARRGP